MTDTPLTWAETRGRLRGDRDRLRQLGGSALDGAGLYLHASYQCVLLHRLSHHCQRNGWPRLARLWWHLNTFLTGADISALANLGPGLVIPHPLGVAIAGTAGRNFTVMACSGLGSELGRREDVGAGPGLPMLGDDVWLEPHSGVMGPVKVGHRVRVCAGLPVACDVPDDTEVQWPPPRIVALPMGAP
jgi:serine O-acetyltransferase